jgi:hypothetical protein
MEIILPPQLERIVQSYVDRGKYQNAIEVILAGVRLLQQEESIDDMTFGNLDPEGQFLPLTESEMVKESLQVLAVQERESIPHSQIEAWLDRLEVEPR